MEEYRLTREWVPLARFGTGSRHHYGRFPINREDLAAKRFGLALSFTTFLEWLGKRGHPRHRRRRYEPSTAVRGRARRGHRAAERPGGVRA
ncbi:hypothetical protein J7S33_27435, partial [Saccharothrix algeriensis]